jgi:hypothetical protein
MKKGTPQYGKAVCHDLGGGQYYWEYRNIIWDDYFINSDIVSIALDINKGKMWLAKDGIWYKPIGWFPKIWYILSGERRANRLIKRAIEEWES